MTLYRVIVRNESSVDWVWPWGSWVECLDSVFVLCREGLRDRIEVQAGRCADPWGER